MVEVVVSRLKMVPELEPILLTTERACDDELASFGTSIGIRVIRGHPDNLVQRTIVALSLTGATHFVRANADSPLVDPELIREGLEYTQEYDLVTNLLPRSYPYGISVEWISASVYRRFASSVKENEKEHVTSHLYRQSSQLRVKSLLCPEGDWSSSSMVVDVTEHLDSLEEALKGQSKDILEVRYGDLLPDRARLER